MTNPTDPTNQTNKSSLAQRIDSALVRAADSAVVAWNNVTNGQSKSDLANNMITAGTIMTGAGLFAADPLLGMIGTPLMIFTGHSVQKSNIIYEDYQTRMATGVSQILENESANRLDRAYQKPLFGRLAFELGFLATCATVYSVAPTANQSLLGATLAWSGFVTNRLADYVMKSRYLPQYVSQPSKPEAPSRDEWDNTPRGF